jgi:hypothetical protein
MKYILIIMAIMASSIVGSGANVELNMGYYNTHDDMSMSLKGSNLNFGSACTLLPQSIKYSNGGASIQPKTEYSYSLTLNGDTTFSSAQTDSGMFAFKGAVDVGGHDNKNLLKLSAKSGVKDGSLKTAYGNDKFQVQEVVQAENFVYQQQADLGPKTVSSTGFGSTLTPVPGLADNLMMRSTGQLTPDAETAPAVAEGKDQGVIYSIQVQNPGGEKEGHIDAKVMGLAESQLATYTKFDDDKKYTFGAKMRGIGFAPIGELEMAGQATGLPLQTLPPGDVEISYKDPSETDEDEENWGGYPELVDKKAEEFDSDYPGKSTPALWYYLNNEFTIEVPVYVYYPPYSLLDSVETYQLGMVYSVRGDDAPS